MTSPKPEPMTEEEIAVYEMVDGGLIVIDRRTGLSVVGSSHEVRRSGLDAVESVCRSVLLHAVESLDAERAARAEAEGKLLHDADALVLWKQDFEDAVASWQQQCEAARTMALEAMRERDEARALLLRADDRLSHYRLGCACPGMPCVTDCDECDRTQGLINEIRSALPPKPDAGE